MPSATKDNLTDAVPHWYGSLNPDPGSHPYCLKTSRKNNMQVRVIGDISRLEAGLQERIRELEAYSSQNTGLHFQVQCPSPMPPYKSSLHSCCQQRGRHFSEAYASLPSAHLHRIQGCIFRWPLIMGAGMKSCGGCEGLHRMLRMENWSRRRLTRS